MSTAAEMSDPLEHLVLSFKSSQSRGRRHSWPTILTDVKVRSDQLRLHALCVALPIRDLSRIARSERRTPGGTLGVDEAAGPVWWTHLCDRLKSFDRDAAGWTCWTPVDAVAPKGSSRHRSRCSRRFRLQRFRLLRHRGPSTRPPSRSTACNDG